MSSSTTTTSAGWICITPASARRAVGAASEATARRALPSAVLLARARNASAAEAAAAAAADSDIQLYALRARNATSTYAQLLAQRANCANPLPAAAETTCAAALAAAGVRSWAPPPGAHAYAPSADRPPTTVTPANTCTGRPVRITDRRDCAKRWALRRRARLVYYKLP